MKGTSFLIALACLQFAHSRSITDPQVLPLAPETNGRCATVRCANGTICRLIAPLNCTNNCELQPTCVPNNDSCPPNQELQSCGSACEETCDQPVQACTMQCVPNVCRCKAGYVKDSNENCILKSDCGKNTSPLTCATMKCREGFMCTQVMINCIVAPCHQPPPQCIPANPGNGSNSTGVQTCSTNEVWNKCGNVCEGQCGQPLKFCPAICKTEGACTCKSGYVRENGVCILESQCPPNSNSTGNKTCAANEIWNQCGALCERKCGDIRRACSAVCLPQGACTCKEGFARQNGACVAETQCPSATPIPGSSCALVDCMAGTTCIEETVQCFAPPCAPIARCVPTGKATCDTVKLKCQENYGCGIVNGVPQCVFNGPSNCAATLCAFGSQCIEEPIPCLVAPCPVQAKCVANSNNATTGTTCAATSCEIGYDCIEETNPCLVAPCPTTARCVQNNNTGITCANVRMKCHEGEQCGMVNGSPTCVKACGANETYQSCSSMCEPRCGVVNKIACIASCGPPMCQCNPGYTRNASNLCVLPKDCGPLANNGKSMRY